MSDDPPETSCSSTAPGQHEPGPSPYAARPWLASYPDGVPADFAFPEVPLTRLLDDAAASFPTRTALAFLGLTVTYRELRDATDHLAAGLARLGVRRGDRVSVVLPNCPQHVLTVFAVLRLGGVVVEHDPASTAPELQEQLADCGARVVVCLDLACPGVLEVRAATAVQAVVVTSLADDVSGRTRLATRLPLPAVRRPRSRRKVPVPADPSCVPFLHLVRTATAARQTPVDPGRDTAVLKYAGGAGPPRPVELTHSNLVSSACMNRLWDTGGTAGTEVTLGLLPLWHAQGMTACLNATVLLAGTLVLLAEPHVDEVLAAVDRFRPTLLPALPAVFTALADEAPSQRRDLSSLRVCSSGGERLPPDVQERFERWSGALLVEGYGSTATSPPTHCTPLSGRRRPGTVGLPLPGTQCRIVDPTDPARDVPVGEPGQLLVRGPQVPSGAEDGWSPTGDVAVMDADGWFSLVRRGRPGVEEPVPRPALGSS